MPSGPDRLLQQLLSPRAGSHGAQRRIGLPDLPQAKVTQVTAGGAADGGDLVQVSYLGGTYSFPHIGSTPAVNDTVVLLPYAGTWLILGTPSGFPH